MKVDKERLENTKPLRFTYITENGQELEYYAFFPSVAPKGCVVCIHGGAWTSDSAKRLFPQAAYFAEEGAVGVSIEYRLNGENTDIRNGLYDCISAIKAIREMLLQRYGKALPLISFGDSAGGYYAVCLGNQNIVKRMDSDAQIVDFVVDLNGIVDLTGKWSCGLSSKSQQDLLGYSPLFNVSGADAPTLIMHGDQDKTVALEDSQRYHDALKAKGVACDFEILSGAAHAFILFDYRHDNAFVGDTLAWICDYLKGKKRL